MAKYSHMFDLAFTVETHRPWDEVTPLEFIRALDKRVQDIKEMYFADSDQITECFGFVDTAEEE
jgi:hypothetical protein